MDVVYGISVDNMDNDYITLEHVVESFEQIKTPGAFWIDSFPFMKHIPAWFPGASAKKFSKFHRPLVLSMRDEPFDAAKASMVSPAHTPPKGLTHSMRAE